ncbi:MAG TPA: glycosyl hydrolase, partial [Lacipirellulaceae bacterium]|nr:glycosyl hydrolase [Lacipirellulaceae bacterium]
MTKGVHLKCLAFVLWLAPSAGAAEPTAEETFLNPPAAARPRVLWMWMGSNISRTGITRDLEALASAGYGGAMLFSLADTCTPWAGVIRNSPTPEVLAFTPPWWELVRHAAEESRRLNLDFGIHNCPGYESSGGPWITPELSMQEIVWSEQPVGGGAPIQTRLPQPRPDLRAVQPYPVFNPATNRLEKPEIAARREFYRDIAVLALPAEGAVAKDQVIDLTARMGSDGQLAWDAPPGEWIVYRFGHTTMGKLLQPGQWEAIGLECDKMSRAAVQFHLDHISGESR